MLKLLIFASSLLINNFVSSEFIYKGFNDTFQPEWWQTEIVYQVYVRSFKDSDGDGVGDINGVTEKVDYFKSINVGVIWLSPIFKSPQVDNGYDVSNYRDIEPLFGTSDDFDRLKKALNENGIKLLLDFIPNHTSDEHPWFQKSIRRIDPYTDYYVWNDGKINSTGQRVPPNNWLGVFEDGSAWQWNEDRKQYFYHAFQYRQPDLNLRNPVVVEEMKNVLLYWLDRGVDGFRFDAFKFIYESEDLEDEPRSFEPGRLETDYEYLNHTKTADLPEVYDLLVSWRALLDEYANATNKANCIMLESYTSLNYTMAYYGNDTAPGAHFPFNFWLTGLDHESNATRVHKLVKSWLINMPKNRWANWVIGNHDISRIASRTNPLLVDGIHMLQMLLPGTAITYYADELGVQDIYVRWDQTAELRGLNVGPKRYKEFSRDPVRSPFPWDGSANGGFTNGTNGTWLPINPEHWHENLVELSKTKSHLKTYRQLGRLRRNPTFVNGDLHSFILSDWVYGFLRSYNDHPTFFVVINLGSAIEKVDIKKARPSLPEIMKVKVSSINSGYVTGNLLKSNNILLRPKAALVLSTSRLNDDSS